MKQLFSLLAIALLLLSCGTDSRHFCPGAVGIAFRASGSENRHVTAAVDDGDSTYGVAPDRTCFHVPKDAAIRAVVRSVEVRFGSGITFPPTPTVSRSASTLLPLMRIPSSSPTVALPRSTDDST